MSIEQYRERPEELAGKRVLVTGSHPHAGQVGTIEFYGYMPHLLLFAWKVDFDDGTSGYVFHLQQLKLL